MDPKIVRKAILGASSLGAAVDAVQTLREAHPDDEFLEGAEMALLWVSHVKSTAPLTTASRWYLEEK